ncbi:Follistatin-related protein 5 [Nymphon striatum]|nr:Follistatin-related protein 5 [Nymphon striatum]
MVLLFMTLFTLFCFDLCLYLFKNRFSVYKKGYRVKCLFFPKSIWKLYNSTNDPENLLRLDKMSIQITSTCLRLPRDRKKVCRLVKVVFYPCENIYCGRGRECSVSDQNQAVCVCMEKCKRRIKPVCGSDGQYYVNHCELHRTACMTERPITIDHSKACLNKNIFKKRSPLHHFKIICPTYHRVFVMLILDIIRQKKKCRVSDHSRGRKVMPRKLEVRDKYDINEPHQIWHHLIASSRELMKVLFQTCSKNLFDLSLDCDVINLKAISFLCCNCIKIRETCSLVQLEHVIIEKILNEETTTDSRNDLFATTTEQQYFETSTYSSSMGSSMGSSETSGSFTSLEKENFSQENIETKSTCNMQDYEMLKENLLLYNNAKLVDGEEDSRRDGKCGDGDDGIE